MTHPQVILGWSGGKDSAMALYELRRQQKYDVVALLTTVTAGYDRISMHGVRRQLLREQAEAVGVPLEEIVIRPGADNAEYEAAMGTALAAWRDRGVTRAAFGDLYLEDVRAYRERLLAGLRMECVFPLWGRNTTDLAREFVALGFRAMICCVDPRALAEPFAGRMLDEQFLADLPAGVDPCGENGEFHSFVTDGPIFERPVACAPGERVLRDSFFFCDLLPVEPVPDSVI